MIFTSLPSFTRVQFMPTGTTASLLRHHNSPNPPPPPQERARSVTSPLTWQCYGGIKRQRKTITDPLSLISQSSGRWEKSTHRVWKGSADWASAGLGIFGAGDPSSEALTDGQALRLTSSPLNTSGDIWKLESSSCTELCNISGQRVELLHPFWGGGGGNGSSGQYEGGLSEV